MKDYRVISKEAKDTPIIKGYLVMNRDGDYRTHDGWGTIEEAYAYLSEKEAREDDFYGTPCTVIEIDLQQYIKEKCLYVSEAKEGFECLEDNLRQERDFKTALDYVDYKFFWWRNDE